MWAASECDDAIAWANYAEWIFFARISLARVCSLWFLIEKHHSSHGEGKRQYVFCFSLAATRHVRGTVFLSRFLCSLLSVRHFFPLCFTNWNVLLHYHPTGHPSTRHQPTLIGSQFDVFIYRYIRCALSWVKLNLFDVCWRSLVPIAIYPLVRKFLPLIRHIL